MRWKSLVRCRLIIRPKRKFGESENSAAQTAPKNSTKVLSNTASGYEYKGINYLEKIKKTEDIRFLTKGNQQGVDAKQLEKDFDNNGIKINPHAIVVDGDTIKVEGTILDTANWDKIKDDPNAKKYLPYAITILSSTNSTEKAFKIFLYRDGSYEIVEPTKSNS